jgi:hypothetical protein
MSELSEVVTKARMIYSELSAAHDGSSRNGPHVERGSSALQADHAMVTLWEAGGSQRCRLLIQNSGTGSVTQQMALYHAHRIQSQGRGA